MFLSQFEKKLIRTLEFPRVFLQEKRKNSLDLLIDEKYVYSHFFTFFWTFMFPKIELCLRKGLFSTYFRISLEYQSFTLTD